MTSIDVALSTSGVTRTVTASAALQVTTRLVPGTAALACGLSQPAAESLFFTALVGSASFADHPECRKLWAASPDCRGNRLFDPHWPGNHLLQPACGAVWRPCRSHCGSHQSPARPLAQ